MSKLKKKTNQASWQQFLKRAELTELMTHEAMIVTGGGVLHKRWLRLSTIALSLFSIAAAYLHYEYKGALDALQVFQKYRTLEASSPEKKYIDNHFSKILANVAKEFNGTVKSNYDADRRHKDTKAYTKLYQTAKRVTWLLKVPRPTKLYADYEVAWTDKKREFDVKSVYVLQTEIDFPRQLKFINAVYKNAKAGYDNLIESGGGMDNKMITTEITAKQLHKAWEKFESSFIWKKNMTLYHEAMETLAIGMQTTTEKILKAKEDARDAREVLEKRALNPIEFTMEEKPLNLITVNTIENDQIEQALQAMDSNYIKRWQEGMKEWEEAMDLSKNEIVYKKKLFGVAALFLLGLDGLSFYHTFAKVNPS